MTLQYVGQSLFSHRAGWVWLGMAHRYIGHALCSCPVGWSSSSWYIGILVMPCTCSYSVDIHKFVNRLACRRLSVTSAPGSPCLTLGAWLSVPGSRCLALGAWLSRCLALGAWLSVPGSQCLALGAWLSVPGSRRLALGAWLSSSFDAASTPSTSHVHRLVCLLSLFLLYITSHCYGYSVRA